MLLNVEFYYVFTSLTPFPPSCEAHEVMRYHVLLLGNDLSPFIDRKYCTSLLD